MRPGGYAAGGTPYLVFKLVERLSGQWRALNGGENLMALVLEGLSSVTASANPATRTNGC